MPREAVAHVKQALDACLARIPTGKRHDDVVERVHLLLGELQAGKVSHSTQEQVHALARAIAAGDRHEAGRLCAALVVQHWDTHREWLLGLKRLLAQQ